MDGLEQEIYMLRVTHGPLLVRKDEKIYIELYAENCMNQLFEPYQQN